LAKLADESLLTSEKEELIRSVKGAVGRHDLSEFMTAEEL
jgi:hypothetical protein